METGIQLPVPIMQKMMVSASGEDANATPRKRTVTVRQHTESVAVKKNSSAHRKKERAHGKNA